MYMFVMYVLFLCLVIFEGGTLPQSEPRARQNKKDGQIGDDATSATRKTKILNKHAQFYLHTY